MLERRFGFYKPKPLIFGVLIDFSRESVGLKSKLYHLVVRLLRSGAASFFRYDIIL